MAKRGRLSKKVALVTGGAGGIGSAICSLFAQEGARIVIADRDIEAAARLEARIEARGGRAIGVETDVTVPRSAKAAVMAAIRNFGGLDILVNGAAVLPQTRGIVTDLSLEDWNRAFAVTVDGAFLMCKYAVPHLRKSSGAAIVNICTQQAYVGTPGRIANNSAKAALLHFTRVLAIDHARDGIRVNSLSPGGTLTKRMARNYGSPKKAQRRMEKLYLSRRLGRPEEMAAGALFLVSDECPFMNAADLLIDGGYVALKGTESMG